MPCGGLQAPSLTPSLPRSLPPQKTCLLRRFSDGYNTYSSLASSHMQTTPAGWSSRIGHEVAGRRFMAIRSCACVPNRILSIVDCQPDSTLSETPGMHTHHQLRKNRHCGFGPPKLAL